MFLIKARGLFGLDKNQHREKALRIDKIRYAANCVTLVMIIIIVSFAVTDFNKACANRGYYQLHEDKFQTEILDSLEDLICITFFSLACVFLVTGILLVLTLRRISEDFYKDYRGILWLIILLTTLPLSFRSILDGAVNFNKWH